MKEDPYKKREIDHFMNDIKSTLGRIETQTTKHNGRLTRLERWMWVMVGGVSILSFFVSNEMLDLFPKDADARVQNVQRELVDLQIELQEISKIDE